MRKQKHVDYGYKVGDRVLVIQDGTLCKAQSPHDKEPWTITTVHTKGTIRIQHGTKTEQINIRRVTPYTDEKIGITISNHYLTLKKSPALNNLMLLIEIYSYTYYVTDKQVGNFFTLTDKVFFTACFMSDSFICGGECHRPWQSNYC